MDNKGLLVVFSGFSGAGKGTIMKSLINRYDNYALSVSATTRKPRTGETEGIEYFFKSVEEFEEMIEKDELVEYANYVGNYYGTPNAYVEEQRNLGKDVILEIEIQGALKIKKKFPDALLIFVTTKDARTLRERLTNRGTEDIDTINKRLKRAAQEAQGVEEYEYIVVNDDLDECVETVDRIIKSAHNKACANFSIIESIRNDLRDFS